MATAIDDQIIEDKDIVVGRDSRGYELSVYVLSERLTQLDVHDIVEDAGHGDYAYVAEPPSPLQSSRLSSVLPCISSLEAELWSFAKEKRNYPEELYLCIV